MSTTTNGLSVACIGLGRIGAGIARRIQQAGFRLIVYNRTQDKVQAFVAAGATGAVTPREAASAGDIVLTCLMDDASVLNTTVGPDGVLAGLRPGAIHIGTSTISPGMSCRLTALHEAQGAHYVAAPVVGRPQQAAEGKMLTFVAGLPEAIERCRPVLETYAAKIIVAGTDPAAAARMKLAVNFFAVSLLESIGEAYVFAEKCGLDLTVIGALYAEFFRHPALPGYLDRIRTRSFGENVGFTLDGGLKDIRLILDAAAEVHAPLPLASLVRDKFVAAQAHGLGEQDWSALTEIARLDAGLK